MHDYDFFLLLLIAIFMLASFREPLYTVYNRETPL